jgi:hypothetical protein
MARATVVAAMHTLADAIRNAKSRKREVRRIVLPGG